VPATTDRTGEWARWSFEPTEIDPCFSWLAKDPAERENDPRRRLRLRPFTGRRVACASALVVVTAWILAALLGGDLSTSAAGPNARKTLVAIVTSIPGLLRSGSTGEVAHYPLFEDTAAWLFAFAGVVTLGLLYRQWMVMREIVPRLVRWGAVEVKSEDEERFTRLLGRVNRAMASPWTTVLLAVAAVALALVIFRGLAHAGLYTTLAPRGDRAWPHKAYDGWWAAAHAGSWPGAVVFFLVVSAYMYFLLAQHLAGMMWVLLTWRGSRVVRFRFDVANMDGYFGWKPLRDLMITVYVSILVHVLTLLPLLHLLPLQTWVYLTVPFGLFIVCNPIYVLTPWLTVSPVLHRERRRLLEQVADDNPGRPPDPMTRDGLAQQTSAAAAHAYLRSMRTFPFRLRELTIGFVTYGIPVVALILNK
jgi:hypothetical protein